LVWVSCFWRFVHLLQGAALSAIALRLGVAAGFALPGWMRLRAGR
jgi:hypothetical protein